MNFDGATATEGNAFSRASLGRSRQCGDTI